jgi:Holliday junction resolvase RusA-like endonuclease
MIDSWTYTAPIVASWARARSHGKTRFTDPKHAEAMRAHALHALATRPRGWPLDAVYRVTVTYCPATMRRRDTDRVLSLVPDALKGHAWNDDHDGQIVEQRVVRSYAVVGGEVRLMLSDEGHTSVCIEVLGRLAPTKVARKRKAAA